MPPSVANQLPSLIFVRLTIGIDSCSVVQQFRLISNADGLEAVFERQLKSVKYMVPCWILGKDHNTALEFGLCSNNTLQRSLGLK